jgi:starch synthase
LPPESFGFAGVEYYGDIGFLKAGLQLADRITTVSPTYATEICTAELGMGLEGLLRSRADVLSGILNGIDVTVWNPATDSQIAARYDVRSSFTRLRNKAALQARMGLPQDPNALLFIMVSRMSWQKGVDLVIACIPTLATVGAQLAILGAGDDSYETAVRTAAEAAPDRVGCIIGYDEDSAHLMQAGGDALLVPSRFEPCGLTQLCALRYGALPVVARTGGLADTVIDASPMALAAGVATGVQFAPVNEYMLDAALRRTAVLYRNGEVWRRLQQNGMRTDVSWRDPARRYAALYREVTRASA